MTAVVFDIETNGLYWEATCVHVISVKQLNSASGTESVVKSFSASQLEGVSGDLQSALDILSNASMIIGHNIINYDIPVLKKLLGWVPSPETKIYDTLVVSRLLNPDRPKPIGYTGKGGPHSLEAWGYRLGQRKPEHEVWDVFTPDMLRRNRADVDINSSLYYSLLTEASGWDWSEAIELEHEVARIVTQQEINGVGFDLARSVDLVADLDARVRDIDSHMFSSLPCRYKPRGVEVKKPFKVNGQYTKQVLDWFGDSHGNFCNVGGPFTRVEAIPLDINSIAQVKDYLLKEGWQPDEWNTDDDGNPTSPKLTESSYGSIKGNKGKLIKDRLLYNHRKNQILGWIERVRSDGRISATANTCGTNTGRFRHSNVVNVPKAADHIFLGKEMRSLFMAPEGKVLIGHDAEGLELRMLAHFMDDPAFTDAVVNGDKKLGTDIHTLNQKLAGLPTRDAAKTFIYALVYGAGDAKLGTIVGGNAKDGADLRKRFLTNLPALGRLIDRVRRASKKGYLKGLDGRKVWMRSYEGKILQNKALNTLLQSAGAIVMKKSMCILDQNLQSSMTQISKDGSFLLTEETQSLSKVVLKVLDMHDEAQAEVPDNIEYIEKYMELAKDSIVQAGEHFKLRVPLAADASYGKNWAETH